MSDAEFVKQAIKRLARIDESDGWSANLNPAQRAALEYIDRANRFSRQPSHVAQFLGSTRGTVTQTLKALARKGYIVGKPSLIDKRSISYDLTDLGRDVVAAPGVLGNSLEGVSPDEVIQLAGNLRGVLEKVIADNGLRSFGICKNCVHFQSQRGGGHCRLLDATLSKLDSLQICHEQVQK
jgi:DNA-binding MarR family transcriptional regulator